MIVVLKRYGMALFFLLLVVLLMIGGTMGVKSFGDAMFEESGIVMTPRGERIQ